MKKLIVIFLSAAMVLGSVAVAFAAELDLGGDFRVRGVWEKNYDYDSAVDDADRYYDQMLSLNLTAKAGEAEVRAQLTLLNDNIWDGGGMGGVGFAGDDYAYAHFPVESVTIDIGRQLNDWGYKFFLWGEGRDRLKVSGRFEGYKVGGFVDKMNETNNPDLKDHNAYGVFALGRLSGFNGGALLVYDSDAVANETGQTLDVFAKGRAGGFNVIGELVYQMGDMYETAAGGHTYNPMGFFVKGSTSMEGYLVTGAFAYAANGYVASEHFTPTVFLGLDQPTARYNLGDGAGGNDTAYALVGSATRKLTREARVGARLAYILFSNAAGESAIEVDATLRYELADNIDYAIDFGYLMPDGFVDNDAAMAIAHKLEIKF